MVNGLSDDRKGFPWLAGGVLAVVCLVLRATQLMALPIFGDEAIYLRWAQLIRADPWQNAFVSLADPKPPLHFWLLAGFWPITPDPLRAARLLSVLAAVLTIPALLGLCRNLEILHAAPSTAPQRDQSLLRDGPAPSGGATGMVACLLVIFCPFLAFYQRLALADSLVVLQSVLIAWAALRFAAAVKGDTFRAVLRESLLLGTLLGLAMLTRQNISYVLWALPVGAVVLLPGPGKMPSACPKVLGNFALGLVVAAMLALAIWSPMLLSKYGWSSQTGRNLKMRIFYQPQFTEVQSLADRLSMIRHNLQQVFVPTYRTDNHGTSPLTGWYWLYLTPAMLVGSGLGLVWLALRRQWRLLAFLGWWIAILLGPLILAGNVMFSRYVLLPTVPLLIALAYLIVDGTALAAEAMPRMGLLAGTVLLVATLAQGFHDIALQTFHWPAQQLTARDRYWFINGWTAGQATQEAICAIRHIARTRPVVVLTDDRWGLPADALWVYLEHQPNVQLYYLDDLARQPILRPGDRAGTYLVHDDKWLYKEKEPVSVTFPANAVVIMVLNDPVYTATGAIPAESFLRARNNNVAAIIPCTNPLEPDEAPAEDRVIVCILNPPG